MGIFLLGRWSPVVFPKVVYLGQSCSSPILTILQPAYGQACACLQMKARFTGLFAMKTTRKNFDVTSTTFRNGVKIGNFVFTLTNVKSYVSHARDYTSYPYKLSGCTVQYVTEMVDLGVSLTSNLSWNTRTQKVVSKANKIVSFLKRNVGAGNKEVFPRLFKPWLYPILEYAVPF